MKLTTTVQEEINGCGIAAVATIVQKPYGELKAVANALGIFASDERLFSNTDYVRNLLKYYAIQTSDKETPFASWQTLPNLALLSTKYHIENDIAYWHWSVFYRDNSLSYVLDPSAQLEIHERTDFDAISVEWYIEIFGID